MKLREQIDRIIAVEIRKGAPLLALALAMNHHTQKLLVMAAAARELDQQDRLRLERSAHKKRSTTKRSTRRSKRG